MTVTTSSPTVSTRRTDEQKREYLRQQLAKTEAAIAAKARKRRVRALIVLGAAVTQLRDAALNARILESIIPKGDREAVAELIRREGSPR